MFWVRFDNNGKSQFGVLRDDMIYPTMLSWSEILAGYSPNLGHTAIRRERVKLLAPLDRPGKIIAVGRNYAEHARENNAELPRSPILFAKFPTTLNDPDAPLKWSAALTQQVDYEAELAVVIGKTARRVSQDDALNYVFGYTCGNDVTARDLQFGDGQWVRGKSLDSFCPLGPVLATTDEIPDPQTLAIRCILNGQVMQESNTHEMIFGVAFLVSFCSQAFTLEPGDVIMTGTPSGVGHFRQPPVYLKNGDTVAIEIDGIGRLVNSCVEE
jgi:2-keto-4-pentenoate hydratase/2-oxohepta-3-ene-1,7-dioic acid hydratase in catechol pathway